MAVLIQNPSLGSNQEQQQQQSPGRNRKSKGRHGRQRHRRHPNSYNRPRSDSESSSASMSDSSTTNARSNPKDDRSHKKSRYHHQHQQSNNNNKKVMMDENLFVALDCEMVGIGPHGKQSSLARVTMIDWNGKVLMDEYVQQQETVTDYRTFVSGITPKMLEAARMDFDTCRQQVLALLEGKILVGHGLKSDLRVLNINHPWYQIRDTAKYQPFMKVRFQDGILWPRGLKDLCQEKLNREVQVQGQPHCPKEDAMAALDLYKLVQNKWEKAMEYKINKTKAIQLEQEEQFPQLTAARE